MTTRIAVLSAAHGHAAGYCLHLKRQADVEVVLADPDGTSGPEGPRGHELAARLEVEYAADYEAAMASAPDGVLVCSENARHRVLVELAIAAGLPVMCEKPLATTISDARALCEQAERAGVTLTVAYPVRQAPSYRRLRQLVSTGALGEVLSVVGTNNGMLPRDRAWFVQPDLAGGGSIVDHVVHCADLVDGLLGAAPVRVRAVSNRILAQDPPTGVETGALVTACYPSGAVVTIDCSWSQPLSAPTWGGLTLDVIGTKGRVSIDPFGQHVGGFGNGSPAWLAFGTDMDALMIQDFVTSVRTRQPPTVPAVAGLRTVQLMCAALESAAGGGRVVEVGVDPIS